MIFSDVAKELQSHTVKEFPKPGKFIECYSNSKLSHVVKLLIENNISSCPVRKPEYKDNVHATFEEAYDGIVDILDIAAFVIETNKVIGKWGPGFEAVLEITIQFTEREVSEVMNASPRIHYKTIPSSTTIFDGLQLLGRDRVQRLITLDNSGHLENIITQTSMARFLYEIMSKNSAIQKFAESTLHELNLGKIQSVISLKTTSKAADAFNVLQRNRVTGVPVVDENGKIVGNLSSRDIRSLVGSPEKFDRLFDTLSEFLEGIEEDRSGTRSQTMTPKSQVLTSGAFTSNQKPKEEASSQVSSQSWRIPGAFTVSWDDSLRSTLQQLVEKKVHRVYLVDEQLHPTGVVTLTDIMHVLSSGKYEEHVTRRGSLYEHIPSE